MHINCKQTAYKLHTNLIMPNACNIHAHVNKLHATANDLLHTRKLQTQIFMQENCKHKFACKWAKSYTSAHVNLHLYVNHMQHICSICAAYKHIFVRACSFMSIFSADSIFKCIFEYKIFWDFQLLIYVVYSIIQHIFYIL